MSAAHPVGRPDKAASTPGMARYRSAWLLAWVTASLLGVCLALLVWAPGAVLLLYGFAAATTGVVLGCGYGAPGSMAPGSLRSWLRVAVTRSAAVGAAVVALAALTATAPSLLAAVAVLAGATSPTCVARVRAHLSDRGQRRLDLRPSQADSWSAVAASTARELTDHDLCSAWCTSFDVLQAAPDATVRSRVVSLRQAYLDEIDRRYPLALSAWLASGARATGNPQSYLSTPRLDQDCDD